MGYPVSVEERTVEKEQLVMHDEMKTMVGWNQNGPNTNEGENTGTLKSDSERFVIDNFGAGSTWHGGVARKSLKEPLQDFTVEVNEETGEYLTFEKINGGSYTSLMQMPYNVGQKMVHTNMTSIVHKQKIKICQPKD